MVQDAESVPFVDVTALRVLLALGDEPTLQLYPAVGAAVAALADG